MKMYVRLAGLWWRIPAWLPLALCHARALNWEWCRDVALQYALVVAAGAAVIRWPALAGPAWFFFGTRQAALSVLGHDATHRHVARALPRLNDAAGAIALWPLTLTVFGLRRFHLAHHANLGRAGDLEREIQLRHLGCWLPRNRGAQIVRDLLGAGIPEILDLYGVMLRRHWRRALPMAAALLLPSAALVWIGAGLAVALWFLALFTSLWALNRIRGWGEHIGLPPGQTRLQAEPPLWARWMWAPYGIWAHEAHHRYPAMPSRQLIRHHSR